MEKDNQLQLKKKSEALHLAVLFGYILSAALLHWKHFWTWSSGRTFFFFEKNLFFKELRDI